jgi:hypothetical protein
MSRDSPQENIIRGRGNVPPGILIHVAEHARSEPSAIARCISVAAYVGIECKQR